MSGSETESGAGVDPRRFRNVLGQFCTGVTIITTVDDGAPVGFACQSFAALSLEPPLVLFCPTKASRSWAAIERSGRFCVNVLAEEQQDTCARFGSREPDKFAGIDWTPSPLGSPILTGSLAHIDCTVETVHDGRPGMAAEYRHGCDGHGAQPRDDAPGHVHRDADRGGLRDGRRGHHEHGRREVLEVGGTTPGSR